MSYFQTVHNILSRRTSPSSALQPGRFNLVEESSSYSTQAWFAGVNRLGVREGREDDVKVRSQSVSSANQERTRENDFHTWTYIKIYQTIFGSFSSVYRVTSLHNFNSLFTFCFQISRIFAAGSHQETCNLTRCPSLGRSSKRSQASR